MNIVSILAGFVTGILSGWGIGGGSLLIIYMTVFAGVTQQAAQGINLLYFLPTSLTALYSHLKNKLIEKSLAWPAICAGALTTLGASLLVTSIDTHLMKKFFGVFIIIIGLTEVFKRTKKKGNEE
ncbi:hypothetical protein SAMN02745823_02175 [Sporobacter termitidis DSM 10068]|uniref:Probable membrane transporter protein n=1 Tax=Sporobacter termitidis DSM 10068 TaxID=1123282 RepID=A0A1M5Y4B8_9FIRM|nr:sulfite exporter TauE/SafE family protein [Sporobacter termitidis]SHI06343.1 hypothetical protein SAMN02745823_02175 [Sporobacter termitidis DSM 10068]